jgi:hypothetical protein
MEKFSTKFVSIFLATILFTSQVIAGSNVATNSDSENYVDFDESEITNSFEKIDDLVNFISANETATYSDIEQTNSSLLENVSASSAVALSTQEDSSPLVIGAFFYGCLFSVVGIILVAIVTNNDNNQIKKAEIGCIVSTVALTALYVLYAIMLGAE